MSKHNRKFDDEYDPEEWGEDEDYSYSKKNRRSQRQAAQRKIADIDANNEAPPPRRR